MNFAREEAQSSGQMHLATEHMLLGVLRDGNGVAAKALRALGLDLDKARAEVDRIVKRTASVLLSPQMLTLRANRVIEFAAEKGAEIGHLYVGSEELLLGLVNEDECGAKHVLMNVGARPERVREDILGVLGVGGLVAGSTACGSAEGRSNTRAIDAYCYHLTDVARVGQAGQIAESGGEVDLIRKILSERCVHRSPILIGESAVSKSAVVHALARRVAAGYLPAYEQRLVGLDLARLGGGATSREEFKQRLTRVTAEACDWRYVLLVLEEVHNLFGAGSFRLAAGELTAIFAGPMTAGLHCVATTTSSQILRLAKDEPWFASQLESVRVD